MEGVIGIVDEIIVEFDGLELLENLSVKLLVRIYIGEKEKIIVLGFIRGDFLLVLVVIVDLGE